VLEQGQHFGEYSCLLGLHRAATVVAVDNCELYRWVGWRGRGGGGSGSPALAALSAGVLLLPLAAASADLL
jgi:hypothetical protein